MVTTGEALCQKSTVVLNQAVRLLHYVVFYYMFSKCASRALLLVLPDMILFLLLWFKCLEHIPIYMLLLIGTVGIFSQISAVIVFGSGFEARYQNIGYCGKCSRVACLLKCPLFGSRGSKLSCYAGVL